MAPGNYEGYAMAAGAKHACAVAIGGATYCWGLNAHGQLGNGVAAPDNSMRDSVAKPVALPAGIALSRIYAGKYHTCGLTAAGLAYCWGRNDYAQLGDGTRTRKLAPNRTLNPTLAMWSSLSISA